MLLSEALGALSIAADVATGRPRGAALTGTVVSVRLAQLAGQDKVVQKDVYYTSIARFLGCTATGPEAAMLAFGDDFGFNVAFQLCDWFDPESLRAALMENVALDSSLEDRQAAFDVIVGMIDDFPTVTKAHCLQAKVLASRLPVPQSIIGCLPYYYARWDGKLEPYEGEGIPLPSRTASIGEIAELFRRRSGRKAAVEEIETRAGKHFDPHLCRTFLENADTLFDEVENCSEFDAYVKIEPGEAIPVNMEICGRLGEVVADMVDQKCIWFAGHSRRVAALASDAGRRAGMAPEKVEILRHAALFHDLGKTTISNRIWNKETELSQSERLEMEGHSYQTEFIMGHAEPLRSLAPLAASSNERSDGTGYHKRSQITDLSANLLAAANEYDVLTHDLPTRKALAREKAADELESLARKKKLSAMAVSAVLQAAGHTPRKSEQAFPCNLTRREAQVLAHLARSNTTARIAEALGISEKTADHHIQSIYAKTDVRGRAAIALFAIEHGIVLD
jgi:HD-GYP domain-containing protein (c-di-GMP phosphodiesterase class II)